MGVVVNNFMSGVVKRIAEKRNISPIIVEGVLQRYLDSLFESALKGERLVFHGLGTVTIKKTGDKPLYAKKSFGFRVRNLSYNLHVSNVVVKGVIQDYIDCLIEEVGKGNSVEIPGIVKLTVKRTESGDLTVRGRALASFAEKLGSESRDTYKVYCRLSATFRSRLCSV